jgi:hypothetical protein
LVSLRWGPWNRNSICTKAPARPRWRTLGSGCNIYIPATTIRMTDGVVILIHDLGKNPVCVDENLIRSQCVVAVVKRLKVLATCREIW